MGEFEFIERVRRSFGAIGDSGIVGIGDDCAVIPLSNDKALVVTTDMLVEGVHFLRHATSARELGAKSLAVNLSDIAAMGARPVASFLSIALPPECHAGSEESGDARGASWADEFMDGYHQLSECHNVALAGGDTSASLGAIAINVTVVGRAPMSHLKYRSGALPGDIIAVAGPLGESAAGLRDILSGRLDTPLAHIHRNPVPQVDEGQWLGSRSEVHAMIDLSDGLASDLLHIIGMSSARKPLRAEVELTAIPTPVSTELAATGGEDYKLLLTAAPDRFATLANDFMARFGSPLHPVGRIVELPRRPAGSSKTETPTIVWRENGTIVKKNWHGFVHF
jgi:thiamine-monophosphate kinase